MDESEGRKIRNWLKALTALSLVSTITAGVCLVNIYSPQAPSPTLRPVIYQGLLVPLPGTWDMTKTESQLNLYKADNQKVNLAIKHIRWVEDLNQSAKQSKVLEVFKGRPGSIRHMVTPKGISIYSTQLGSEDCWEITGVMFTSSAEYSLTGTVSPKEKALLDEHYQLLTSIEEIIRSDPRSEMKPVSTHQTAPTH